jgi:hypothetical protein
MPETASSLASCSLVILWILAIVAWTPSSISDSL